MNKNNTENKFKMYGIQERFQIQHSFPKINQNLFFIYRKMAP